MVLSVMSSRKSNVFCTVSNVFCTVNMHIIPQVLGCLPSRLCALLRQWGSSLHLPLLHPRRKRQRQPLWTSPPGCDAQQPQPSRPTSSLHRWDLKHVACSITNSWTLPQIGCSADIRRSVLQDPDSAYCYSCLMLTMVLDIPVLSFQIWL